MKMVITIVFINKQPSVGMHGSVPMSYMIDANMVCAEMTDVKELFSQRHLNPQLTQFWNVVLCKSLWDG